MALVIILALSGIPSHTEKLEGLTWEGVPATLAEIAEKTGRDIVDSEGNYKHVNYEQSLDLWEKSILKGNDGVLDLHKQFTREQAMIVIVRLLNMEEEALNGKFECKFIEIYLSLCEHRQTVCNASGQNSGCCTGDTTADPSNPTVTGFDYQELRS